MPIASRIFVRTTSALLLVGLLVLLAIGASSLWLVGRTNAFTDAYLDVLQLRRAVLDTFSHVQDAETGQRGYLLTQEQPYLEPYRAATADIGADIDALRGLAAGRPDDEARVAELVGLVAAKLAELDATVDLARAGRVDEAMAIMRTDRGKAAMDAIRRSSFSFVAAIDARQAVRADDMRASGRALTWALLAGGALILCVVGGSAWLTWRYTRDLERARAEILASNDLLEQRVRERTADLVRANEEIQRFAYVVSHDLRSPLVNVMGFTSELEAGLAAIRTHWRKLADKLDGGSGDPAAAEARAAVETDMPEAIGFIRASTAKMDKLINAILKLAREGGRKLQPQRVDMAALFENAADSVRHQLAEGGGDIAVVKPMPDVTSDRLALEQVFGNLLDNAVKYSARGRPGRIEIRGREAGGDVVYEVADNGRGIAAQDHERVFELFRRSGAQDQPGEGIGLPHVRALVRRLGGEIGLESELGEGTTFRVRLPRQPAHPAKEGTA